MPTTWIEAPARSRLGGPVRAGLWSAIVIGTHPIELNQEVWVELRNDEQEFGTIPGFWVENKGVNSFWHVPIPPLQVNSRLKYRACARVGSMPVESSAYQEMLVRPNLPSKYEPPMGAVSGPEGLVGNRHMTVRVDERGSTYDVFYPTAGLNSNVRPAAGEHPSSRTHFRAIVGGLASPYQLEWFCNRRSWEVYQRYQGATNLLVNELTWRHAPVRVLATDFVAMGPNLPYPQKEQRSSPATGQYFKRFRILNDGDEPLNTTFGLYVHTEVNGGQGEPLLSWMDNEQLLVASNRGHPHANRKLARDATIEFSVSLDDRGPVSCEAVGPNEAMLLRPLQIPAQSSVQIDILVSGGFTGWKGDLGTFEHWILPARRWFHEAKIDDVEQEATRAWDEFVEALPTLLYPRMSYSAVLRRSALAAALHADAEWGAIAAGFDRGINAYCWPRDALFVALSMERIGHPSIADHLFNWLDTVRGKSPPFKYWFQKFSMDGAAEWETPAADQTALILWAAERHYRATGDEAFLESRWPMIEQAAAVCLGDSGHPGLRWLDDLKLISSAGIWDDRFGAFFYTNATVVAGLRAAARLARLSDHDPEATLWQTRADEMWELGMMAEHARGTEGPGLVDPETGRFLEGRRLSYMRAHWTDQPNQLIDVGSGLGVSLVAACVPLDLLPADDPRARATADAILRYNIVPKEPNSLTRWSQGSRHFDTRVAPSEAHQHEASCLATLWMARYLLELGRRSGEEGHWTRAVAFLNEIIARLGPLGVGQFAHRLPDEGGPSRSVYLPGVWPLHGILIDCLLDFAGMSYDVPSQSLTLDPVLPADWPHIGIKHHLTCGAVGYRLERPPGGTAHILRLECQLKHAVLLRCGVTCPGIRGVAPWRGCGESRPPRYEASRRRLEWEQVLPPGESSLEWSWG